MDTATAVPLPLERTPLALLPENAQRDLLWDHCRNSLGIARLLDREGRSRALVATACATAVETACRAALEQAGHPFDGSLERALDRLGAPYGLTQDGSTRDDIPGTERVVAWVAGYLRHHAPEKSWGY
jgi:hypothetical protein